MQQKNEGELHLQPNPCLTIYLEVFWWNDKGMHVYGIFISNRWVKGSLSIFECHFVSLIFNSFQNAFSFPQSGCKQVFFFCMGRKWSHGFSYSSSISSSSSFSSSLFISLQIWKTKTWNHKLAVFFSLQEINIFCLWSLKQIDSLISSPILENILCIMLVLLVDRFFSCPKSKMIICFSRYLFNRNR